MGVASWKNGPVDVLAFPFRFNTDGTPVKVVQDSEAHHAQQLAALVRTMPGELPLAPQYGVPDPTFDGLDPGAIAAAAALFHPTIVINDIAIYATRTGRIAVQVDFGTQGSVTQ
jgi:hypothetical protein